MNQAQKKYLMKRLDEVAASKRVAIAAEPAPVTPTVGEAVRQLYPDGVRLTLPLSIFADSSKCVANEGEYDRDTRSYRYAYTGGPTVISKTVSQYMPEYRKFCLEHAAKARAFKARQDGRLAKLDAALLRLKDKLMFDPDSVPAQLEEFASREF